MLTIYHNNRCGKSRTVKTLLDAAGTNYEVIDYLNNPPSEKELKHLLELLGMTPLQLIRTKEDVFQENFKGKTFSDVEWIKILVENPILIERPIVVFRNKAWVVRSPEAMEALSETLNKEL